MLVFLIACADPGRSDEGLLLLDGPALDAGWHVELDGEPVLTALPVHEADGPVLVDPEGAAVDVELYPDEVTVVEGVDGEIDWLILGEDIARDAVELVGDAETAEDLAEQLDGRVDEVEADIWLLEAPDVWDELTWATEPDGLYETLPLHDPEYVIATSGGPEATFSERLVELERRVDELKGRQVRRGSAQALEDRLETEATAIQDRLSPWLWVGAWEVDGRCVILDAAGGVDDCQGADLGAWQLDDAQPTLSFQLDSAAGAWVLR